MEKNVVFLLAVVMALVLLGILMVYSASIIRAENASGWGSYKYLIGQVARVALGLVAFFFAVRFDYHKYQNRTLLILGFVVVVAALGGVLLWGTGPYGTKRWFNVFGLSVQPSDFAKPLVLILLAVKLSENQKQIKHFFTGFVPPLATTLFISFLIALEPDIGTPFVLGSTAILLVMMAGARWIHLFQSGLAGVALVGLYVNTYPHASDRLQGWLYTLIDPMKYRSGETYQLIQSLWAFAQGGIWGVGPGGGQQKLHYLYAAESDFIFAVCGEELGLIGTLLIALLFASFLILGMRIALSAPDLMGALLAAGIVTLITFQSVVSMGVTTGLLPTKGITLPFISSGGSSLVTVLFLSGILINIGMQAVPSEDVQKLAVCV